jgi:hypothetical protein
MLVADVPDHPGHWEEQTSDHGGHGVNAAFALPDARQHDERNDRCR